MISPTIRSAIRRITLPTAICILSVLAIACSGPSSTGDVIESSATGTESPTQNPVASDSTLTPASETANEPPTTTNDPSSATATSVPAPNATATPVPDETPPTETPGPGNPTEPAETEVPESTATDPPVISNPDPPNASVRFEQIASGFVEPTLLTHADDGTGTLYVTEKGGSIRTLNGEPFINLRDRVIDTGLGGNDRELGLLGLAFHPDFETNGYFFVHYNDFDQNSVISRFQVNADGTGDPTSEKVLLTAPQSEGHFNGGTLLFGPDGYLYMAFGTGGNLPEDHAASQDLGSIFGKLLRIDVDDGDPYAIPADNPYVDTPGARPEVWVYGLRNPWRFAFDRATGDIYIAEPGQFSYEWVHFQPAGPDGVPTGGINFGWPIYEGYDCFDIETETTSDSGNCQPPPDYQAPIFAYPRGQDGGCVIIGGSVYRGPAVPDLQGAYLYSDFCSASVSAAWRDESDQWRTTILTDLPGLVSSFGEDEAGEIYILDISQGLIYKMVPG